MAYELQDNHETISQQFISYVTSHADIQTHKNDPTTLRESYWKVGIKLPLLRDSIEEVSFIVRNGKSKDEYGSPDNLIYDVGIHTSSGLNSYFTYDPQDTDTPYIYSGVEAQGVEAIEENDIAKLLSELSAYEASGQVVKIEPQVDSSK